MCYSAQVKADYKKYVQMFGAVMSIRDFYETFWRRSEEGKLKIPKGMEDAFADPQTDEEREIKALIDGFRAEQATKFEQEVFKQKKRLADAERTLQTKTTKAATDSKRIASEKIEANMRRLADLHRTEPKDSDNRIFSQVYAPVVVWRTVGASSSRCDTSADLRASQPRTTCNTPAHTTRGGTTWCGFGRASSATRTASSS